MNVIESSFAGPESFQAAPCAGTGRRPLTHEFAGQLQVLDQRGSFSPTVGFARLVSHGIAMIDPLL